MGLVGLIIVLVICGAGLYLIGLLPIDATMKQVIKVIIIVIVVVYVLVFLAGLAGLSSGWAPVRLR